MKEHRQEIFYASSSPKYILLAIILWEHWIKKTLIEEKNLLIIYAYDQTDPELINYLSRKEFES